MSSSESGMQGFDVLPDQDHVVNVIPDLSDHEGHPRFETRHDDRPEEPSERSIEIDLPSDWGSSSESLDSVSSDSLPPVFPLPSQAPSPPPPQRPPPGQRSGFRSILFFLVPTVCLILILSISSTKSSLSILHQVPEGHVGVYWRGGALLKTITNPGFHLKMPLVTQHEAVQVTLQTDQVKDIPCGTNGGVMINFEKIEVVNRLHKDYVYETLLNYGVQYDCIWIYDKIHHEINKFCSSHSLQQVYIDAFDQIDEKLKGALQRDCIRYAPGIEIISVHATKPTIPDSIRRNFEQLEEERIKVLIAIEKQKIAEKEADTMKKMAVSGAEKMASVSEKDSARKQQEIVDQMITWLVRRVWQMLKENQICTRLMGRVWQMLRRGRI
ncbi:erlin [Eucalyptus grandis]|nr:erlin [Eucalyptus grandis]